MRAKKKTGRPKVKDKRNIRVVICLNREEDRLLRAEAEARDRPISQTGRMLMMESLDPPDVPPFEAAGRTE